MYTFKCLINYNIRVLHLNICVTMSFGNLNEAKSTKQHFIKSKLFIFWKLPCCTNVSLSKYSCYIYIHILGLAVNKTCRTNKFSLNHLAIHSLIIIWNLNMTFINVSWYYLNLNRSCGDIKNSLSRVSTWYWSSHHIQFLHSSSIHFLNKCYNS